MFDDKPPVKINKLYLSSLNIKAGLENMWKIEMKVIVPAAPPGTGRSQLLGAWRAREASSYRNSVFVLDRAVTDQLQLHNTHSAHLITLCCLLD